MAFAIFFASFGVGADRGLSVWGTTIKILKAKAKPAISREHALTEGDTIHALSTNSDSRNNFFL